MSTDMTVLIVTADEGFGNSLDRMLNLKRFQTKRATSLWGALKAMPGADILVLAWSLPNGNSKELLDYWLRSGEAGPILVLSLETLTPSDVNSILQKAWNVMCAPFDLTQIGEIMERYAWIVRGVRCCRDVVKLRRRVNVLIVIVAALGGTQVLVPLLQYLL